LTTAAKKKKLLGSHYARLREIEELEEIAIQKQALHAEFRGLLSDWQRRVLEDKARRVSVLCPRRTGKTQLAQYLLLQSCMKKEPVTCGYVGLKSSLVREQFFTPFLDLAYKRGVPIFPKQQTMTIEFGNKSKIIVGSCNDRADLAAWHGFKMDRIILDEASFFPEWIEQLASEVLGPCLADTAGSMIAMGTPGPIPKGYFHKATTEAGPWSIHNASIGDNTFFPRWGMYPSDWTHERKVEAYLDEESKTSGMPRNSPGFRREYLGEWCADTTSMIFDLTHAQEHVERDARIVLIGVDIGFRDSTAFVVLGIDGDKINELETVELIEPGFYEIAEKIKALSVRYSNATVVMEPATGGRNLMADLQSRYGINVQVAEKAEKAIYLKLLASDIDKAAFRFCQKSILKDQLLSVYWNPERRLEDPRCYVDRMDACLYAYRACLPYLVRDEPEKAFDIQEQRVFDAMNYKPKDQDFFDY